MSTQKKAQYIIDNCVIIDTETTGLGEDAEIIELAAVDPKTGEVLINTLINTEVPIEDGASAIHGIDEWDLVSAPKAEAVVQKLLSICDAMSKTFTSYNHSFDERLIHQSAESLSAKTMNVADPSCCVMELANRHFAADYAEWDRHSSRFKRMSLARCCEIAGIKFQGEAHRALADTLAAVDLLHFIANDK